MNIKRKITCSIISVFVIILMILPGLADINQGQCLNAVVQDISPSSVGIDEEFTVGISLESCGSEAPTNIKFEIIELPPDIIVIENISTYIPVFTYADSKRQLVYHMHTTSDAKPGIHIIKMKLTYGTEEVITTSYYNVQIIVRGGYAKPRISSVKIDPALPYNGDTVEITMRVENAGNSAINSVKTQFNHPFQGPKEAFVGTLDPNEDGPAVLTFIANKSGNYELPVIITYNDDYGEKQLKNNVNIVILEKNNFVRIYAFILLLVAIIAIIGYYSYKKIKAKDTVIKQLMQSSDKSNNEE